MPNHEISSIFNVSLKIKQQQQQQQKHHSKVCVAQLLLHLSVIKCLNLKRHRVTRQDSLRVKPDQQIVKNDQKVSLQHKC